MKTAKLLAAMAATALAAGALALPPGEPPTEPPMVNDCSPGFWKNHPEYWVGPYCGYSEFCVGNVMEDLTAKGKGSGDIRQERANDLNSFADEYYEGPICSD